jgi:hypothetical protein
LTRFGYCSVFKDSISRQQVWAVGFLFPAVFVSQQRVMGDIRVWFTPVNLFVRKKTLFFKNPQNACIFAQSHRIVEIFDRPKGNIFPKNRDLCSLLLNVNKRNSGRFLRGNHLSLAADSATATKNHDE